jgi:hypothetical protein
MEGAPVRELGAMLASMAPALDPRPFAFVLVEGDAPADAFALVREAEGMTAIRPDPDAAPAFARITLTVHSDLEAVGLTAAVSAALADAQIACNIIAGFHHDHLFVPWERRDEALGVLERLSRTPR